MTLSSGSLPTVFLCVISWSCSAWDSWNTSITESTNSPPSFLPCALWRYSWITIMASTMSNSWAPLPVTVTDFLGLTSDPLCTLFAELWIVSPQPSTSYSPRSMQHSARIAQTALLPFPRQLSAFRSVSPFCFPKSDLLTLTLALLLLQFLVTLPEPDPSEAQEEGPSSANSERTFTISWAEVREILCWTPDQLGHPLDDLDKLLKVNSQVFDPLSCFMLSHPMCCVCVGIRQRGRNLESSSREHQWSLLHR